MTKDFRFGIGLRSIKSSDRLREKVRRFEGLGFDVVHFPDHIGAPAPFPAMVAAADAARTIRVGTFVLNAAFYSPALLARDAVDTDLLSDGRLELGLGTGYVREEFEAAEIPYPSAGERVAHLRHVTTYLKSAAPSIPLLIAGNGDKVLTIAAQHADIIGLTGGGIPENTGDDPLGERVDFVRAAAGDRFEELELNLGPVAIGHGLLATAYFSGYNGSATGLPGVISYVTSQLGIQAPAPASAVRASSVAAPSVVSARAAAAADNSAAGTAQADAASAGRSTAGRLTAKAASAAGQAKASAARAARSAASAS